jgi:hypothetical protein
LETITSEEGQVMLKEKESSFKELKRIRDENKEDVQRLVALALEPRQRRE